tara:strand:+ start:391 stop:516 length:126 start_codon:yes stop_codon:yes gene_type:complete
VTISVFSSFHRNKEQEIRTEEKKERKKRNMEIRDTEKRIKE